MTSPSEPTEKKPAPSKPVRTLSARRRWLFRIIMLLVIAVVQEPLFRIVFPRPEIVGFNRIHYQQMASTHSELGRAMQRGLVYDRLILESRPDGFLYTHDLNGYGFRGPDVRADPTPGRRRILVIGDSVVEGQGAADSGTIPAEWSRLLAKDGIDAEVVNLGVIAATLPHLWILTRDAVRLLNPSDVVLALYCNDMPAPNDPRMFSAKPPDYPRSPPAGFTPRIVDLVDRLIYEKPIHRRWPRRSLRVFMPAPDTTNPWSNGDWHPPEMREELYQDMKTARLNPWLYAQSQEVDGQLSHDFTQGGSPWLYLDFMNRACKAVGARLVIAYTPFCGVVHPRYASALADIGMDRETAEALSVDPKYLSQNRHLADICVELKLPLADSTEALKAAEAGGAQFWAYDTHPNTDGYATIARHIHETWMAAQAESSESSNSSTGAAP